MPPFGEAALRRDRAGLAVASLLFLAGMALTFRYSWLPGPSRSIGDNGDGNILVATLEHWFRAFSGHAAWMSPEWFWPAKNVLGQTDTYFLFAIPYSAARLVGFGPFGSYTATIASLAVIGFWGLVLLARQGGAAMAVAGVFGFVFAFGALPTFKIGHGQTYTAMLTPCFGLLLLGGWRARTGVAAWAAFVAAGLLYGLTALTAPQTAWFLSFETALFVSMLAVLTWRLVPSWLAARARLLRRAVLASSVGLLLGLVPVAVVFRQTFARERAWTAAQYYMPRWSDILNVQEGNLLWYDLLHRFGIAGQEGRPTPEVMLGFTPVLAVCGLLALFAVGWVRRAAGPHPWDDPARACLAVAFLGWLVSARWGHFEPWYYVYSLVPGATGIRTPFRIQMASSFFLCLGLAHAASRVMVAARVQAATGLAAGIGATLAFIAIEQLGAPPPTRDTWAMMQWLMASHRPDFPCTAFYVIPPAPGGREAWFEYQADAMLLSQWIAMPTINGNSSWYPDGWGLTFPDRPDYARQALAWIDRNGLRPEVCGVDPRSGHWVDGIGPLLQGTGGS